MQNNPYSTSWTHGYKLPRSTEFLQSVNNKDYRSETFRAAGLGGKGKDVLKAAGEDKDADGSHEDACPLQCCLHSSGS